MIEYWRQAGAVEHVEMDNMKVMFTHSMVPRNPRLISGAGVQLRAVPGACPPAKVLGDGQCESAHYSLAIGSLFTQYWFTIHSVLHRAV